MVCDNPSFLDMWQLFTSRFNEEESLEVAVTAKMIWDRRNNFVHKQDFAHPNDIISKAKVELWFQAS